MSFRDHPVFTDAFEDSSAPDAVIIGLHDRIVRPSNPRVEPPADPADAATRARTAARLEKLAGDDWCVVAGPLAGADQLVVGTRGAYAVSSTRLVGTVLVAGDVMLHNGHCTDHLSRMRSLARRLSIRLSTEVQPLLVVDADDLAVREEAHGVGVTSSYRVRKWLRHRPEVLERATVFRVASAAQRQRTWR